jgi:hypothetical protein
VEGWNRFWFSAADPTLLGTIRLCTGLLAMYVLYAYSFDLQELCGKNAWVSHELRTLYAYEYPMQIGPLGWERPVPPVTPRDKQYRKRYFDKYHTAPPLPYPQTDTEEKAYDDFIADRDYGGFDPRFVNLPLPETAEQKDYIKRFVAKWRSLPPPPYPKDRADEERIDDYIRRWGVDSRIAHSKGAPIFSIWLHVIDPFWMAVVHGCIMLVMFLFTIGFCTRITSVVAWAGMLSYTQRSPATVFGMDTMINILMIYLMIGPSGAAVSVDRQIKLWWAAGGRTRVITRWRIFWANLLGRPLDSIEPAPEPAPLPSRPTPLVSANLVIRLLQIHLGIIYLAAGISKLKGPAWWKGTAVWLPLATYEFAPLQFDLYLDGLRWLSKHHLLADLLHIRNVLHAVLRDRLPLPDLAAGAALGVPRHGRRPARLHRHAHEPEDVRHRHAYHEHGLPDAAGSALAAAAVHQGQGLAAATACAASHGAGLRAGDAGSTAGGRRGGGRIGGSDPAGQVVAGATQALESGSV